MKPKFWIDCPICSVKMKQVNSWATAYLFKCELCNSTTTIEKSRRDDPKSAYRRDRLSERIIK